MRRVLALVGIVALLFAAVAAASTPKSGEYFNALGSAHGHYALLLHTACRLTGCTRPSEVSAEVSVGNPGQTTGSCPDGTFYFSAKLKKTRFADSGKFFLAGHFIKLSITGVFDSATKISGTVSAPPACGGTDAYVATPGPIAVEEVPTSVTGAGVVIDETLVLAPLRRTATAGASLISEAEGLADARSNANNPDLTVGKPLLVSFTAIGTSPSAGKTLRFDTIVNVPAWVTTFTAPEPVNVAVGGPNTPEVLAQHFSVAINAANGKFLRGFFTP